MRIRSGLAVAAVAVLLMACAAPPQPPVEITAPLSTTQRIGVAMAALPQVDTHLPGADCLLCMAAASVANRSLTTHARTLPVDDVRSFKNDVAQAMRKKGVQVEVIAEDVDVAKLPDAAPKVPNGARKDFTSLRAKYNVDKLVVVQIDKLGMLRTYSAYIPTSDPKGVLEGAGYLVDLGTNVYEWYLPLSLVKSSEGAWDEPPAFPGLTNAYFQVIEQGRDRLLQPFAK